jgi:hypothetical protein
VNILQKIRWALDKDKLESNLIRYCELEYKPADRSWALAKLLKDSEIYYLGNN